MILRALLVLVVISLISCTKKLEEKFHVSSDGKGWFEVEMGDIDLERYVLVVGQAGKNKPLEVRIFEQNEGRTKLLFLRQEGDYEFDLVKRIDNRVKLRETRTVETNRISYLKYDRNTWSPINESFFKTGECPLLFEGYETVWETWYGNPIERRYKVFEFGYPFEYSLNIKILIDAEKFDSKSSDFDSDGGILTDVKVIDNHAKGFVREFAIKYSIDRIDCDYKMEDGDLESAGSFVIYR